MQQSQPELRTLMRPLLYVSESQRALVVFQRLKQQHSSLPIVVDEYGQTAGIITMGDLLEELVGDITSETDIADMAIVCCEDGTYLAIASYHLRLCKKSFSCRVQRQ